MLAPAAGRLDGGEVDRFVAEMSSAHGFDPAALTALFDRASRLDSVLAAISRPAEYKPWHAYRPIFLTRARVDGGVAFWREHFATLAAAAKTSGVPPEIIVAIIGVETFYGRYTGKFAVLDALYTLGFHYPKRAKFFRKQLGEFLLLAREETVDPRQPMGSYAGAMGRPQFIPSSYRAYAVDFDQDGKRDIWDNDADVIGSVANYFARHDWRAGAPITAQVTGVTAEHAPLLAAGMKPSLSIGQLRAAGLQLDAGLAADAATSLIELEQPDGAEHWAGLHNFYVITRYNHSNLYAMAVYQLSREILALHNTQMAATQRDG